MFIGKLTDLWTRNLLFFANSTRAFLYFTNHVTSFSIVKQEYFQIYGSEMNFV